MQHNKINLSALFLFGFCLAGLQAQTVKDIDGNVYKTVTIGTQTWLAENLKTTKFSDGKAIPLVTGTAWNSVTTPGYCWYDNKAAFKTPYGAMYNWFAVNSGKLCPSGWHVPDVDEWTTLTNYSGGENSAAGKLKEAGTTHWKSPNADVNNESMFTALPGGSRFDSDGSFYGIGVYGNWWSSTENESFSPGSAFCWIMDYRTLETSRSFPNKRTGMSVRCVMGPSVSPQTTIAVPQNNTAQTSTKVQKPLGPVTIRNETLRFELTAPEGWSFSKILQQDPYEEFKTGRYSSSLSTGEGDAVPENWNGFRLRSTGTSDGPQPALIIYAHKVADQKPEDFAKLLETSLTNFRVTDKTFNREFSVGDATGFDCVYNLGVKVRYAALYKNGIRVTIQYFFPSNDPTLFEKYSPEVDKIIKSIRFK